MNVNPLMNLNKSTGSLCVCDDKYTKSRDVERDVSKLCLFVGGKHSN